MSDAQGINSVEIAVTILDALAKAKEPTRAIDLAQMTGMSKSRLHKYLVSLCRKQILYQNPHTNRYSFGQQITALHRAANENYGVYHMMNSKLRLLSDRIKCPTALVIQKENILSLIHYNHHDKKDNHQLRVETHPPLSNSAAGKVFLTYQPELRNSYYLNTSEHDFIKDNGYCIMDNDPSIMNTSKTISCPIFDGMNNLIAAAVLAHPVQRELKEEHHLISHLISTVDEINQNL